MTSSMCELALVTSLSENVQSLENELDFKYYYIKLEVISIYLWERRSL